MPSPIILHIETSGKNCSVSVSKGNELLCLCEEMTEDFSHSKKLHLFIQWALEGAEIEMKDLQTVSVSKGPGSYTGLRIGVSSAKGLAMGLNIPLLATQTLRTMAMPYFSEEYAQLVSTLKARKDELYLQLLNQPLSSSEPDIYSLQPEILDLFEKGKKYLVLGSAADMLQEFISVQNPSLLEYIDFNTESKVSSEFAIAEALSRFEQSEFEDLASFEPQYIKSVHITESKKNKI